MKCSIKKFSEMYETVYRDLYRYALCLMKNPQEAEDAVSEAVITAYENIHKLKKEEAFKSWIFTILTNKCKKRLKKALREEQGREEELPEQSVVPDYDLAMDVRKAFFVLSEEEQILVGLSVLLFFMFILTLHTFSLPSSLLCFSVTAQHTFHLLKCPAPLRAYRVRIQPHHFPDLLTAIPAEYG